MKSVLEIYKAENFSFKDSGFSDGQDRWSSPYLYEKVKESGLVPERVCIRHLDLSRMPWQSGNVKSLDTFLYHMVRVQDSDYTIPIILGWDGYIMDGWHRLIKAILEGRKTIEAYRLEGYIEPDEKGKG